MQVVLIAGDVDRMVSKMVRHEQTPLSMLELCCYYFLQPIWKLSISLRHLKPPYFHSSPPTVSPRMGAIVLTLTTWWYYDCEVFPDLLTLVLLATTFK